MRTLVDIPEEDLSWLDERARSQGKSRASIVREAVATYRARQEGDGERRLAGLRAGFGVWKGRTDIGDAVAWQRRERAGWTRPWDPDYDEVRAEYPDLFDEADDRERAYWRAKSERTGESR
jgi:hypothetical protein